MSDDHCTVSFPGTRYARVELEIDPPTGTIRAIAKALRDGDFDPERFEEMIDRDAMRLIEGGRDWRVTLQHKRSERWPDM